MATVKEDIETLKKVQVLDKDIYDLKQLILHMPEKVHELDLEFETKKARFNELEEKIKLMKLALKDKELDLGKKDGEAKKFEGQLSQVKTNKEYSAILSEIANVKADKGMLEEKILVDWDGVEKLGKDKEAEKKNLDAEQAKLNQEKKRLEEEGRKAEEQIKQFQEERTRFLSPVTQKVKDLYEKILAKREGVAIARIDGENCGGCQFLMRPQIINDVRREAQIVLCERCTRILYYQP